MGQESLFASYRRENRQMEKMQAQMLRALPYLQREWSVCGVSGGADNGMGLPEFEKRRPSLRCEISPDIW